MEHFFDLPVSHKGEQLTLKGRLVTFAYNYKFFIIVEGQELTFEKDDEGQFRVINERNKPEVDRNLLSNIVGALEKISTPDKTG